MSPYKLKKHMKTKKFKHFKIPFFGHQLPPQSYTKAHQSKYMCINLFNKYLSVKSLKANPWL